MNKTICVVGAALLAASVGTALAVAPPPAHKTQHARHMRSPAALLKVERAAMQPFANMAGIWRGKATMTLRGGRKITITQTERVGPFLGGSVMVMEGRGYNADGKLDFNAFGIVSYRPATKSYTMRAYAQGRVGSFPIKPTKDGFTWTIKAGPVTMRYTATIKDGTWHEVGVRTLPNGKSVQFIEITLKHVGKTDWPAVGAVPFKP